MTAPLTAADGRTVTLSLSMQDLLDLSMGLALRMDALNDARTYRGHKLRTHVDITAERVASLAAQLYLAIKQLEKLPGGAK